MRDWGRILIGVRLEKVVESEFVLAWSKFLTNGKRKGDGYLLVPGLTAHKGSNVLVRELLKSNLDTLCILDSDADFGPQFLEELRTYEPGMAFDALQAFYCRRGWPPEAIWFKQKDDGTFMNTLVLEPDCVDEVALVGTHCCLFRREIFEAMLVAEPDIPMADFDWFHYPRHSKNSEDSALSLDARALGFRMGATTHVKMGHLSKIVVGWETYMEWIEINRPLIERKLGMELEQYDTQIAREE